MEYKKCSRCGELLPLSSFSKRIYPNGTVNFKPYCKPCHNKRQTELYHQHKKENFDFMVKRRKSAYEFTSKNRESLAKEQREIRAKCSKSYIVCLLRQQGYSDEEITEERIKLKEAIIKIKSKLKQF